jgi:hypothetical protein
MLFDGILETTTTTGTGDLTTSAVTGRPRFTDFFAANASESSADPFYYAVITQDSPPQFLEIGIGYCSAAGTLKRQQIIATYASGTLAHFGSAATLPAGTKNVICTAEAASLAPAISDIAAFSGDANALRALGPENISGSIAYGLSTKDRLIYVPIRLSSARMVVSITAKIANTAGSSGTHGVRMGLYASLRTGGPGRKILESGDLPAPSQTTLTYSFSAVRLPPGWYYGAIIHDFTSAPTLYCSSTQPATGNSPLGWNIGAAPQQVTFCYEALTPGWSAMPAAASAAGALTDAVPSGINCGCPYILLGVA